MRPDPVGSAPGLGPARRAALLAHFGGLARLRAATPDQIREVKGIGPRLAAEIAAFLAQPN